jgi:hypothetical protein
MSTSSTIAAWRRQANLSLVVSRLFSRSTASRSSYRANAEGKSGDLVTPHDQYLRLGRSVDARREAYRELFHAAPDEVVVEDIRRATNGGFVLGSARFAQEIGRVLGRRVERGKPGRPRKKTQLHGRAHARGL